MIIIIAYDALSEGASVREKRQKKVWIFRPIDVFNLGVFRSDDLVILRDYGILAWKDRPFFLDFMLLSNDGKISRSSLVNVFSFKRLVLKPSQCFQLAALRAQT